MTKLSTTATYVIIDFKKKEANQGPTFAQESPLYLAYIYKRQL